MKLKAINTIHAILQEYLTVTHQNYLDYKKLLESKESMGGKISDDEANVLDKLRENILQPKMDYLNSNSKIGNINEGEKLCSTSIEL